MNLDDLTRVLAASESTARGAVEVTDLAYDARRVTPGAVFFCVPGSRADGHDFAAEAVAAGAVALVVERPLELDVPQLVVEDARASMAIAADVFFGEPTRALEVAGVTGTNGKTTTTFLLRSVLAAAGRSPGLVGTVDWVVGGEVRPAPHTTPEAIDLQRLFREMLDAGDRSVAVEASSHGSALHRLDRVRFDALVFTNLSQDHLDLHGTMEEYYQAKRRLFTGAQPPPAAVNVGDEHGRRLALELVESRRAPLITFGLTDAAEIRPEGLEMGASGSRFRAGGIEIETPLRGRFNVENVLGVIAAGVLLDIDDDELAAGIRDMPGIPGRFEAVDEGQPFAVIVDYAHTPDSLDIVLQAARELGERPADLRLRRRRRSRPRQAARDGRRRRAARRPRDRDLRQPAQRGSARDHPGHPPGGRDGRRDRSRPALGASIVRWRSPAPDDVVVIAGKGHEQGQETAGVVAPFDDRVVVREALREAGFGA